MSIDNFLHHVHHSSCRSHCPYHNNVSLQREFIDTCLSRLEFERAYIATKESSLYGSSLSGSRLLEKPNGATVVSSSNHHSSSSSSSSSILSSNSVEDNHGNILSTSIVHPTDINLLSPGSISTIFPSYPTYISSSKSSSSSSGSSVFVTSTIVQFINHTIDQGLLHALPLDTLDPSTPLLISVLWLGDEELALRFLNDSTVNPPSLRCTNKEGTSPSWIAGCLGMMKVMDIVRTKSINLLSGFVDSIYRHTILHALSCDESFINSFTTHAGSTVPLLPADHPIRAEMIKIIAMEIPLLLELRDAKGYTPLEHAMRHGSINCVLALLSVGAKLPVRYRGETLSYERSLRIYYPDLHSLGRTTYSTNKNSNGTSTIHNRKGGTKSNPVGKRIPLLSVGNSTNNSGNPPLVESSSSSHLLLTTPTAALSSESISSVTDDSDQNGNNDDGDNGSSTVIADYVSSDDEIVHCDNQGEDLAASSTTNPVYYHQWRKTKRAKQRMLKTIEKLAMDQGINWTSSISSSTKNNSNNNNKDSSKEPSHFEFSFWGVVRVILLFSTIITVWLLITLSRKVAIEKAGGLGNIVSGNEPVLTDGRKISE